MPTELVECRHTVHGGVASFPKSSLDHWIERGWQPIKTTATPRRTKTTEAADSGQTTEE